VVHATVEVSNTGNVRVSNITLTSDEWTGINCTGSGAANISLLNPGGTALCTASYTFTQTVFENAAASTTAAGSLATSIIATATGTTAPAAVTANIAIPTAYSAAAVVHIDSCTIPATAGEYCRCQLVCAGVDAPPVSEQHFLRYAHMLQQAAAELA
jgi:hypothetical protein